MNPEYDESDEEANSVTELSYPYLDDLGVLHLKNSNSIAKNINGRHVSISSELNDKTSETVSLLKETKKSFSSKSLDKSNSTLD